MSGSLVPRPAARGAASLGAALVLAAACADAGLPTGTVLVASGFTDQVFVLDAATGAVVDSISLDRRPGERDEPHALTVSRDGRHWYATVSHGEPTLWKFEAEGNRLVGRLTLPLRGAGRVRLRPDGTMAAVADYWLAGGGAVSQVALVRTHDLSVAAVADVCPAPHDAVFDPRGQRLAVTCAGASELVILDGTTLVRRAAYRLAEGEGVRPMNAVWSADGRRIYVSLMGRSSVAEVDLAEGAVREIPTAGGPAQLELTSGDVLVVAERMARSVTLLDPTTESGLSVGVPGEHPHGVAVTPDGRTAFVTYEGTTETRGGVVAVEVETGRILWHTPLGSYVLGVAYSPFSSSSSEAELMQ